MRLATAFVFLGACSPPLPQGDLAPAESVTTLEGTWAGPTSDANLSVALVSGGGQLQVYLCDGVTDAWFRGPVDGPTGELVGPEGRLAFDLYAERAYGVFLASDGTRRTFDVPRDDGQPLFRHESQVGDDVVLGGWIRLPDGSQRGAVRVGPIVQSSSLMVSAGAIQGALCSQCGSAGPLQPAPFTPMSLGAVRANVPRVFTFVALGESYASGEGAPVRAGGPFTHDGMLEQNGVQETWGDGLPKGLDTSGLPADFRTRRAREARACHRSDGAASVLAHAELTRRWSGISFAHVSFACSGAQVPQLVDAVDTGAADCDARTGAARTECYAWADDVAEADAARPQLQQLDDFVSRFRTSVDAVTMSVGGNDLGFGLVIEDCLTGDCSRAGASSAESFSRGQAALPGRWRQLQAALAARALSPQRVAFFLYPNPLRRSETAACRPEDYPGEELILKEVTPAESDSAFGIHRRMNETTGALAADAGFVVFGSHVAQTPGHAMCNGDEAWFNTTARALRTQGVDLPPAIGPLGIPFRVSTGMVHPNAKGHREMYLPVYLTALEQQVERKFTPAAPSRVRVVSASRSGGQLTARLVWDDRSLFESHFRVTAPSVPSFMPDVPADSSGLTVTLPGLGADDEVVLAVEACFSSHRTLCSPPVRAVVSTRVPEETPTGLAAVNSLFVDGSGPAEAAWQLSWNEVSSRRHGAYTVELVTPAGQVSRRLTERASTLVTPSAATHFRVASCNFLGCGPASGWVRLPARPAGSAPMVCGPGMTRNAFGLCVPGLSR